ncbi:acyl-CoA reductase-like NAD-dependent aldehyde dehydrogenase [Micromonospora sp. Llam0]|uniref:aldehyde dehydrogenase family protein n=1 Tax=Micromonospora sp. Llam0 TaxID=2485143 RepID=UPI000F4A0B74|nr:aldehyde dehydrogenase family protein [Micromonospora sp. Llam0]ROO60587.1 acyl-CoA reductase-like NAD-dependent aldehyde dehydrogenase [Micromonospora sp. Llam0]
MTTDPVLERFRPGADYRMFIGGDWIAASDSFEAVDPSLGTSWAAIGNGTAADVETAVAAARKALLGWRRSSPSTRQAILAAIADRIEENAPLFARLLPTENGRPVREVGIADVPASAAIYRYYAGLARSHRGDQIPVEDPDSLIYTVREPLGVIAAILPWNSPLITTANKLAPALACGNTVVLKPSEFASASVLEFVTLIADLLPPGVVNVVTGFGAGVGSALVGHPDVAKVTLTGGGPTARAVMATAAGALTPTAMELGGKSAMIVAEDADLGRAVADAALGIYLANGEACIASSRLLLHEGIAVEFLDRLAALARSIVVGDALDPATQVGPMVSRPHFERVLGHVRKAREEGVRVLAGDEDLGLAPVNEKGFFLRPTLLHDPSGAADVVTSEVFGPVTVAETFVDYDEAVLRANATRYGLAAGVWTTDLARAHRIAGSLQAGIVWVNKWFDLPAGAPMGGVKDSGFGRELSWETMLEYSAPKTINIDLGAPRFPLWG